MAIKSKARHDLHDLIEPLQADFIGLFILQKISYSNG